MNDPKIRIYKCINAFKCGNDVTWDDECSECKFSQLHTSDIGCNCDFYVKQEIYGGV